MVLCAISKRLQTNKPSLPIDALLPEVIASLRRSPSLVLVAPPGAGKTTRVPPALVDAGLVQQSLVLLQPRRVAARAAARRIAAESGWTVGQQQVGYQVRFDRQLTAATRIKVVTEGILLRWLQDDPFLEGVDLVLFDEFHLRSVQSDLCLGLLRELSSAELRPELRLVVMSATLEPGPIAGYLGNCPVLSAEVERPYPVTIELQPRPDERPLAERVVSAARRCLREHREGDVLVFLPGAREIRQAAGLLQRTLEPVQRGDIEVAALHGSLPAAEQDALLGCTASGNRRRRIVLTTNVAETSLTIPGISCVVDSGLVRLPRHDPRLGLDRLEVCRVSRDSADQRAGRAGRVGPGFVCRLWTPGQHNRLTATTPPEIQRVELASVVLTLASWGSDPSRFAWLDRPDDAVVQRATTLLTRLGALDARGLITDVGRKLLGLPLHPRLARMLLQAEQLGCLWPTAGVAALLAEGDIVRATRLTEEAHFRGDDRPSAPSDLIERLELIATQVEVDRAALRRVVRVQRELFRAAKEALASEQRADVMDDLDEQSVRKALLAGFPDRVARRRQPGSDQAVMVGGRGVVLARSSVVREAELFVAVAVEGGDKRSLTAAPIARQGRVLLASAIERQWLPTRMEQQHAFDEKQGRVVATERWLYEDLCLEQRAISPDPDRAASLLARHAAADIDRALALGDRDRAWLARVRFVRHNLPVLDLPSFDEAQLRALLPTLCVGRTSLEQLRKIELGPWLAAQLSPEQLRAVERNAPERIEVPSGARIPLAYQEPGEPPILAVQLQQMFGLAETPRVASGRVPVLLHLLAPNQRPVQVTQDLRSFWDVTYTEVRKELRRRYPKHAWPDDPWTAEPERRPRRRRR